MDRLISEKQVLDAVDKVCRGSVEYRVIYDRCEELIKAIPSAEPKWIPVTEKLPEDGERVIVTYDKIVIRATWDLMRYSFYDTHAVGLDKDFVYAWMPLPKPYEPQESEEV